MENQENNIIFVTTNPLKHKVSYKTINYDSFISIININLENIQYVSFDTETNGLSPINNQIVLITIHFLDVDYNLDCTLIEKHYKIFEILNLLNNKDILFIGHNMKFDYKMVKTNFNISIKNIYDTQIAEQRIYQGLGISKNNTFGIKFSLEATRKRRLKHLAEDINKEIRMEFVGKDYDRMIFLDKHIEYASSDTKYLKEIKDIQDIDIARNNMNFLIYGIEMKLISVLGDCELNGLTVNKEKWIKLSRDNEIKAYEYSIILDNEIKRLADLLFKDNPIKRSRLLGGKWSATRQKPIYFSNIGLFGEEVGIKEIFGIKKKKINFNVQSMNYDSTTQIIDLFARLELTLPTTEGLYVTPILNDRNEIINNFGFTTKEDFLQAFLLNNLDSPAIDFVKNLIEFRGYSTRVSNFGEYWYNKYANKKTGKIYTIFRQCEAVTSRLQSGDKNENYINVQNVPAEKEFRSCFEARKGYKILTIDLSGAEVVICGSEAQDKNLIKMAIEQDDLHSPLCQASWRNIYLYRAGLMVGFWEDAKEFNNSKHKYHIHQQLENHPMPEVKEYYLLYKTFEVNKKVNKSFRTTFKAFTFGAVYQMYKTTAAKTLNIAVEEGQIAIDTIKDMIPDTFKMINRNIHFAKTNGYLILNNRTNSRLLFPNVIAAKKAGKELSKEDFNIVKGAAANAPIQSTQADMVKEMMVRISELKAYKDKMFLLMQVHDELVYEVEDSVAEQAAIDIPEIMSQTAGFYLNNIEMGTEHNLEDCWTK